MLIKMNLTQEMGNRVSTDAELKIGKTKFMLNYL